LKESVAYARSSLPEQGRDTKYLIGVLERLAQRVPPVFEEVLCATDVYELPEGVDPFPLAMDDYFYSIDNKHVVQTRTGGPIATMHDALFAAACARSDSFASGDSMPIIWEYPVPFGFVGRMGLGRFDAGLSPIWDPSGTFSKVHVRRDMCWSTMMPAGSSWRPTALTMCANKLIIPLAGWQIVLIWPATPANIVANRDFWIRGAAQSIDWAITNLEGLHVLVVRERIALKLSPFAQYAFITLRTSLHLSNEYWSKDNAPAALRAALAVKSEVDKEMRKAEVDAIPPAALQTISEGLWMDVENLKVVLKGINGELGRQQAESVNRDFAELQAISRRVSIYGERQRQKKEERQKEQETWTKYGGPGFHPL
jgi:hypothetical protein